MSKNDYFIVNRKILRCAGLWAPETSNRYNKLLYKFYAIFVFLFVNVYFTSTEFISLLYTYKNLNDFIKNVNFGLTHLMGAIKVIFWYYKGNELIKLMEVLEDKEFIYERTGHFVPEAIMAKYKRIGIKYTLLFFSLAHLTLTSSYLPPTITALSLAFNKTSNKSLPKRLPYFSWMPFNFNSPGNYLLAIGYQAGPMFSYAYSIVGMDSLFMNLMNFVAAHLSLIQAAFETVKLRAEKKLIHQYQKVDSILELEMKKICKHLQTVFSVCTDLERIHKYLTLAQATATLFILCTCLYLVSTTPVGSKQFLAELVYMVAMGFQLVLYCWFGNEVTLKADGIPVAIWKSDWLRTSKNVKMMMMFTMLRMKRPLHFTVGKFAPLTLATFVTILRASYSVFAVIKNTSY